MDFIEKEYAKVDLDELWELLQNMYRAEKEDFNDREYSSIPWGLSILTMIPHPVLRVNWGENMKQQVREMEIFYDVVVLKALENSEKWEY